MSNKRGRTVKRPNFVGAPLLPKEERTKQNHDMMSGANMMKESQKTAQDVAEIAKMLDQVVLSDAHFATIIAQVNELLIQRERKQP
jgi:hypothetical protein